MVVGGLIALGARMDMINERTRVTYLDDLWITFEWFKTCDGSASKPRSPSTDPRGTAQDRVGAGAGCARIQYEVARETVLGKMTTRTGMMWRWPAPSLSPTQSLRQQASLVSSRDPRYWLRGGVERQGQQWASYFDWNQSELKSSCRPFSWALQPVDCHMLGRPSFDSRLSRQPRTRCDRACTH